MKRSQAFSRSELLLGIENIEKLSKKHVLIVGCGGVGSNLEGLVRTGVGFIDLVDNDIVSETDINRQLIANYDTLGQFKVDVMKKRLLSINPQCQINTINDFILPDNLDKVLNLKQYDYVIDAIDTISTKIALIQKCQELNVRIISCMGTGNKLNPQLLRIADIYETSICPLAKVMRRELKKRGIKSLKVCYSIEEPKKVFVMNENSSRHTPGSVSFVPAVAGMIIASEVIKDLISD